MVVRTFVWALAHYRFREQVFPRSACNCSAARALGSLWHLRPFFRVSPKVSHHQFMLTMLFFFGDDYPAHSFENPAARSLSHHERHDILVGGGECATAPVGRSMSVASSINACLIFHSARCSICHTRAREIPSRVAMSSSSMCLSKPAAHPLMGPNSERRGKSSACLLMVPER